MKLEPKFKLLFIIIAFASLSINAQEVVKNFASNSYEIDTLNELKKEFGTNKIIPTLYETQILIALSYFPELKNTIIEFKLKKTNTPLSSRPNFFGLLQSSKKRKYIITISELTNSRLEPILLKNLNFNAQIGVLGHELSHVSDYMTKSFSKMCNLLLIEIFSKNQVDKLESRTDHICINHGLGYQLLDWSKSVRKNLNIDNWRGADNFKYMTKKERYLNPETIIQILKINPLYHQDENFTNKMI
ncbi:hypothetical protein [Flavobacterium muglaense]|uniref:Uncharacterized protein n=1 Tax=Flavobacterium muglaense TaxID=2764716 RepID=A0A923N2C1_9FLAO|nr:hypothetical protein [Flavobacterium muglaense]MBC5838856.1 hypothetical protein [Flavobacterium muglaense]MBC5845359.1 hypothetical protein [Flavobacterium muglaense]